MPDALGYPGAETASTVVLPASLVGGHLLRRHSQGHARESIVLQRASNHRFALQTEFSEFVHYLGGSVRKDYSDQVTHVISHANLGEKYLVTIAALHTLSIRHAPF